MGLFAFVVGHVVLCLVSSRLSVCNLVLWCCCLVRVDCFGASGLSLAV